jgi:hypothetical protein
MPHKKNSTVCLDFFGRRDQQIELVASIHYARFFREIQKERVLITG